MLNCFKGNKRCINISYYICVCVCNRGIMCNFWENKLLLVVLFQRRRPDIQWNNFTCCLSYIVSIMPANVLATTSAGMVLTKQAIDVIFTREFNVRFHASEPRAIATQMRYVLSMIRNYLMMTSSNGNIFRVTGPLCGEFTGLRWIPRTKASDAELWCFLWSTPE